MTDKEKDDLIRDLLRSLRRLENAARHRETTLGDPIRFLACKEELSSAAGHARCVIAEAKSKLNIT